MSTSKTARPYKNLLWKNVAAILKLALLNSPDHGSTAAAGLHIAGHNCSIKVPSNATVPTQYGLLFTPLANVSPKWVF